MGKGEEGEEERRMMSLYDSVISQLHLASWASLVLHEWVTLVGPHGKASGW